ncbi:MAG: hypothetical protein ACPG40_09350, partial [Alphaproteobacteria bacterium]
PLEDSPFSCDGRIYQIARFPDSSGSVEGAQTLYELEPIHGVYNYTAVSTAPFEGYINSLAFNALDGHMYVMSIPSPKKPVVC